jgi:hypothetical protein
MSTSEVDGVVQRAQVGSGFASTAGAATPAPAATTTNSQTEAAAVPEPLKWRTYPAWGAAWLAAMLVLTYLSDRYLTSSWKAGGLLTATRCLPCLAGLLGLFAFIGSAKLDTPAGALINQQNVMSLSRLQMVLWTVLVLSFFSAVVLARLASDSTLAPMAVHVDSELWGLLGISSASLVGTPLLLSMRRDKIPVNGVEASAAAAKSFNETPAAVADRASGPIYANASPSDARFSDIFEGDELSNTQLVDVSKVQMFVFTVVSALVWTVAACRLLGDAALFGPEVALPVLPSGMVTLLGVSNAGYLFNKLIDHTQTK